MAAPPTSPLHAGATAAEDPLMLEPLQRLRSEQVAETDPYRRAWRLIDIMEWLVKWETSIVIGDLLDRFSVPADLRIPLARSLSRPSLGHWVRYLQLALAHDPPERPFRAWDRVLDLERRHQLVSFRNSYAHGAVERDDQALARCARYEPVVEELLATPFVQRVGLHVVTTDGHRALGGPQPEAPEVGETRPGTYAWIADLGLLVWLWPLAGFLTDRDTQRAGLYFHNAVRANRIEALNYDLPDQVRRPDLLAPFRGRVPLEEWRAQDAPELDPNRLRIIELIDGLVGRDAHIERLFQRIVDGATEQVVLGPPGQGKSALVAAVIERLRDLNDAGIVVIDVFLRRGDGSSTEVPVLRSMVTRVGRLLGRSTEPASTSVELAEQLRTLLVRWSTEADRTLLLVVDGLDERPDLLAWLPTPGGNVRLLWSARPTGEVLACVTDRGVPASSRWHLDPLDTDAVRAVLYRAVDKLDPRLSEHFVAAVRRRSQGNPLFLTALSDLLYERRELIGQVDLLPTRIAELFAEAVDRATEQGRETLTLDMLHLLAVAEERLSARALADLLDANMPQVRGALTRLGELLQAEPPDGRAPDYGLYHDALRSWLAEADPEALLDQHQGLARAAQHPERSRAARHYLVAHGITHLEHLLAADPHSAAVVIPPAIDGLADPETIRWRATITSDVEIVADLARLYGLAIDHDIERPDQLVEAGLTAIRERAATATTAASTADPALEPGVLHDALIYRGDQRFTAALFDHIDSTATGDDVVDIELRVMLAGRLRRVGDEQSRIRARVLLDGTPPPADPEGHRIAARAAYEQAYLDHLEDDPQAAISGMHRSEQLASRAEHETGRWVACCVAAQFRYHAGELDVHDYDRLLIDAATYFDGADPADTTASRWVTNVAAHRFDLALDRGDLDLAQRLLVMLDEHPWVRDTGRHDVLEVRRRRLALAEGRGNEVLEEIRREVTRSEQARPVREGRARDLLDLARAEAAAGAHDQASSTAKDALNSPPGCATWPWRRPLRNLADDHNTRSGTAR